MKFYIVNDSVQTKEIGPDFPQIQDVRKMNSDLIIDLAMNFGQPFERELRIGVPVLKNRSIMTDFLSSSIIMNTGFIVKDTLVDTLIQFSQNSLQIFDIPIVQRENPIENYKYCHFSSIFECCINFEQSEFKCFGENLLHKFENLDKMEEFIAGNPDFTSFYPENVSLKYCEGLELFKIHRNLKSTYCTQIFVDWYLSMNGSGLAFRLI
jgi:hypothetical protein